MTISADYCFISPEERKEATVPVLVVWDDNLEAMWALPVAQKGPVQYAVNWFVQKLDEAGYRGVRLSLKTEQELAILNLKKAVAAARIGETALIESPVRCSKANGMMEKSVKTWEGQMRTVKHHLETVLKSKIVEDHVIMQWMAVWVAEIIIKTREASHGTIAYEAMTGHKCKHKWVPFGELVNFKIEQDKTNKRVMESNWGMGIFVGVISRSTEYLVMNKDIIFKASDNTRVTEGEAHRPDIIDELKVTVEDYVSEGAKAQHVGARVPQAGGEGVVSAPVVGRGCAPRRLQFKDQDFMKYGYSVGCPGCLWTETGMGKRQKHSESCRRRIEVAMSEDPMDKVRLGENREHMEHWMAREIEKGEEKAAEGAVVEDPRMEEEPKEEPKVEETATPMEEERKEYVDEAMMGRK